MTDIYLSVGTGLNSEQEKFVLALEKRLRSFGINPQTIGRNAFSADAPLRAVTSLMDRCEGAIVLALERLHFPRGIERRGSKRQEELGETRLPTPWNQIEAALAYDRQLPLLVIVDGQLRSDGLLEKGNDWYVLSVTLSPDALNSAEFSGVIKDWRTRIASKQTGSDVNVDPDNEATAELDPSKLSVGRLVGMLKPAQFWAMLIAFASALAGAFALGRTFGT